MYGWFGHVCLCTIYVCTVTKGPKRAWDPLKPEFQMAVSCHVGAGDRPGATESSLQLSLHSVKTGFHISPDWLPNQHPAFPSLCRSTLSVPFLSQPCLFYLQDSGFHSLGNLGPADSSVLPKWAPWFCNSGCVIYCEECSFLCLCLLRMFLAQPSSLPPP